MDKTLAKRLRFGRYLEMSGDNWGDRCRLLGSNEQERNELREEFGSKLVAMTCTPTLLMSELGPGIRRGPEVFEYELSVRLGYMFRFTFTPERNLLAESGYVPEAIRKVGIARPSNFIAATELRARLLRDGVCSVELIDSLGAPDSRYGWWPYETWVYREHLTLELRLGVCDDAGGTYVPWRLEGNS